MNQTNKITQPSDLSTQSFKYSPLELLNLYLTDSKSTGPKDTKLYQKFNRDLTWDNILNKGYQSDLCPLLYYIITKTDVLKSLPAPLALWNEKHIQLGCSATATTSGSSSLSVSSSLSPQYFMISPQHLTKLKALYHQNLIRSMIMFNELDKILNTFEKEGIDVIQLKGAELAKNYS